MIKVAQKNSEPPKKKWSRQDKCAAKPSDVKSRQKKWNGGKQSMRERVKASKFGITEKRELEIKATKVESRQKMWNQGKKCGIKAKIVECRQKMWNQGEK